MKKVYVFIGSFGSGKTELALNLAFRAAACGKKELIDLDLVNTYFRLSEHRRQIEAAGIRLISPNYVSTNVETLSLPAEVVSAFDQPWDTVVFDAGGDPAGATALGRFYEGFAALPPGALEVLHVVNARRPFSADAEALAETNDLLQRSARLAVTGFVNNTNLAVESTPDDLRLGYTLRREVSEQTGVPVVCTAGRADVLQAFLASGPEPRYVGTPFEIQTYMHRDWQSFLHEGLSGG